MSRTTFELLILGSSAASPTSERNSSAQLLNISERYILIDCGEGTQIQLRKYKAKFQAIDHIFISHLHGDHFFGLPGLLGSMHLLGRKQELNIYGPEGLKEILDTINRLSETRLNFNVVWHFTDNTNLKLLFDDEKLEVFSFPLKHRIFCTGFLFREKPLPRKIDKYKLERLDISVADIWLLKSGKDVTNSKGELISNAQATLDPLPARSYAYCCDTAFDAGLADRIRGVNLLYHDCTFMEDQKIRAKKTFHSTAMQAATLAKLAGVEKLLLGHFSARYRKLDMFIQEASEIFENSELALDGKKLKI